MGETVVGLFQSRSEAEGALRNLEDAGFGPDQVSLRTPRTRRRGDYLAKHVAGLVGGAVLGLIAGALLVGLVPGVRALFHAQILAGMALGAVAGTVTGGVAGGLLSMAASGDRALYYEQEVESGRYLVSVGGPRLDEARAVPEASGALEASPVEAPIERGRPRPAGG